MKYSRIMVSKFGGPENLHLIEEEIPEPHPTLNQAIQAPELLESGMVTGKIVFICNSQ